MWFLISMVYMTAVGSPEIFVYKKVFPDKEVCQAVYYANGDPFVDQMLKIKPKMLNMSLTCVDRETLNQLKLNNKMKNL